MNKRTIIVFILICAASSFALAQTKQDTFLKFLEIHKRAQDLISERSYRIVTKTDDLEKGVIVKSVTEIYERLFPIGAHRWLTTEKIGKKETSNELIYLRGIRYRRKNNEPWTIEDYPKSNSADNKGIGGANIVSEKYTEELTTLNGKSARKFCSFSILKKFDAAEAEGLSFANGSSWFDKVSGLLMKSERTKGSVEPRVEKMRSVTTYEYDPKIKIEAPIAENRMRM